MESPLSVSQRWLNIAVPCDVDSQGGTVWQTYGSSVCFKEQEMWPRERAFNKPGVLSSAFPVTAHTCTCARTHARVHLKINECRFNCYRLCLFHYLAGSCGEQISAAWWVSPSSKPLCTSEHGLLESVHYVWPRALSLGGANQFLLQQTVFHWCCLRSDQKK